MRRRPRLTPGLHKLSSDSPPTVYRPPPWAIFLCITAGFAPEAAAGEPEADADTRQVYTAEAPAWLRAVGQLRVPGSDYRDGRRSHRREDCSATLVSRRPGTRADTVITAWHCLEFYHDLSRPITFTLLPGKAGSVEREAYRLADGGGMHADWAILRLYRPVDANLVAALAVHPGRAEENRPIAMAGYSRDGDVGDHGRRLTFDPDCRITARSEVSSDSDCQARKGASGGAVVQVSETGIPLFSGVISQGDGAGFSTFVPVAAFRGAIVQHLR